MTTQPASLPRSISLQDIDMFSAPPVQKVSVVIPVYNEQESLPDSFAVDKFFCLGAGSTGKYH